MLGNGYIGLVPTQPEVQIPIVTMRKSEANAKVSEFPVPPRPPRTGKRGAEQNKLLFIQLMDKVYFSILALKNIREVLEPIEPASELWGDEKNEKKKKEKRTRYKKHKMHDLLCKMFDESCGM